MDSYFVKCEQYLDRIEVVRHSIQALDISAKIVRLRDLIISIYDRLYDMPDKGSSKLGFIDLYTSRIICLLEKYADVCNKGVGGSEFEKVEREVVDLVDITDKAFRNLHNSLYEGDMIDMSTDVEVLRSILKQQGLEIEEGEDEM